MLKKILRYIRYILFLPFWWLQLVIPRNNKIWIFGCWYGTRYSDNSRYLFEYVKNNCPEIKPIWITKNQTIKQMVSLTGSHVYSANSLRGVFYTLVSKKIFVSSGKKDVNCFFGNGAKWIQLWHGNPMKKIGLDDKFSPLRSFFQSKIAPTLFPFISETNYDYVVSNSSAFSDKMASAFGLERSKILETGCPRNDVFYDKNTDDFNDKLRSKFSGCRLIYYLPTFRSHNSTKSLFALEDYSLHQLEAFLERENLVFVSKGHYVDNRLNEADEYPNNRLIHLSDEEVSDINFMLKDADLLITDYSGAYFDFLLLERPIVFAAFDLEEYLSSSREMYFDYKESIAGPIVRTWDDLYKALSYIWENHEFEALVKSKNLFFNKFHDNQNSKRVFETFSKL